MRNHLDKKFESRFKQDWLRCFPHSLAHRLPDQQSRQKGSTNPCDFICYVYPYGYFIECKTHKGVSIPFSAIRQYDSLVEHMGIPGLIVGIVCWFYEHDLVVFIPIDVCQQIKATGKKSIAIKDIDKYDIVRIPSVKLRTFMESDYTILHHRPEDYYGTDCAGN